MDYRGLLLAMLVTVSMAHESCCSEEAEGAEGAEEEPLLGLLDYVLLAAIAGVCFWWFFMRESDSDKIPEYEIKPMVVRETSTVDKGFLSKMRKTGRRMVVFYGSQTGTAEEFAGRLAKEGARYGFKGIVADPEEENMEDLQQLTELDSELGPCLAVFTFFDCSRCFGTPICDRFVAVFSG